MKKSITTESIWLLSILIVSQILSFFFRNNTTLDINLHDTYGRASNYNPLFYDHLIYFITFCFWVYFIRVFYLGFKIVQVAIIFLILTWIGLYFLNSILFVFNPPVFEATRLPQAHVKGLFYGGSTHHKTWLSDFLKIFLILTLTFTSFMIGKNWKKQ